MLLLLSLLGVTSQFDLTIFHTNDIHARFDERGIADGGICKPGKSCYGGMARHSTYLKQNRGENSILVSGGDWFTGTIFFTVFKGNLTAEFINSQNYTAIALGNHEFDKGPELLADMLDKLTMPILCTNIDVSREPRLKDIVKKSMVRQVNGTNVGIVGYIIEETKVLSSPGPTVEFSDPITAVREESQRLKLLGVNVIVAIGHAGFAMDKRICEEVLEVDVIVGGHSNTFLYTGSEPSIEVPEGVYPIRCRDSRSVVVQDYAYGKYMGHLTVSFDKEGDLTSAFGNPVLMDSSIEQDPIVLERVNQVKKITDKYFEEVLGFTNKRISGDRNVCRQNECMLGDILADAYLAHYRASDIQTVMAIVNGGSIRTSIDAGEISYGNLLEVTPFGNTVDRFSITGKNLLSVFEHGVSSFIEGSNEEGAFLQIAGAKVAYNVSRPVNERVMQLYIQDSAGVYKEVSLNTTYRCVTNNYILAGGDLYTSLQQHATDVMSGSPDIAVFEAYVREHNPLDEGVVRDRIVFGDTVVIGGGGRSTVSAMLVLLCTVYLAL